MRMRGGIVDEINKIVEARVKSENFDLVFDKSGPSLNGVPVLLYSRDSFEFTDEVIKALNKNKEKDAASPKAEKSFTESGLADALYSGCHWAPRAKPFAPFTDTASMTPSEARASTSRRGASLAIA